MDKSSFKKEVKLKDDGRYIIFYSFAKQDNKEEKNVGTKMESSVTDLGDCCQP